MLNGRGARILKWPGLLEKLGDVAEVSTLAMQSTEDDGIPAPAEWFHGFSH